MTSAWPASKLKPPLSRQWEREEGRGPFFFYPRPPSRKEDTAAMLKIVLLLALLAGLYLILRGRRRG
jgi:hypothetical protein